MLDNVYASRFIRVISSGKNRPSLLECEKEDGSFVEVVVKGSATTIEGCKELAIEAICGMFARDIGLPIPEFFAVELDNDFISNIPDLQTKQDLAASCNIAFGSKVLPSGFTAWIDLDAIPIDLQQIAAEIYTFDAIIINSDRRPENPNCLFSGSDLAIIDHELCFTTELFWQAPWTKNGFESRSKRADHIFSKPRITNHPINLDRFSKVCKTITDDRIEEYFDALPVPWSINKETEERMKSILQEAIQKIDVVVTNSIRALK